jgi:hypothetical protein
MKYALVITMLVCSTACNNASEKEQPGTADTSVTTIKAEPSDKYIHTFTDTALETKITDALMKLSFIKKSDAYIDSFSNHKHGIAFMMDEAKENEKEVTVRAGYNGGERFETYYHFVVDPKTMEIKVYDPVEDKTLTLKEYLKTQR